MNQNNTTFHFFYGKISRFILVCFGLFFCLRCENPITGMGPQPSYIDKHEHNPMLNVFAVLRPDSINGKSLSFVHLEESVSATSFPDSLLVTDAEVKLFMYDHLLVNDSIELDYTDFNSTFNTSEYRNINFYPIPGQTYGISCIRTGYPKLASQTTVPLIPEIKEDTIWMGSKEITFTILRDSLAALYDIYYFKGSNGYNQRIRPPGSGDIFVKLDVEPDITSESYLIIYAYDLKLSEYLTYNVSIKPNTYRSNYSTVENGYGCFGSMTVLKKSLK
jgi:hypothetical protein